MTTRIITDSTCDLPPEFIQRYGIEVIPIGLTLDHRAYQEGVDITASAFYRQLPNLRRTAPLVVEVCGVVTTHVGPNALGVAAVTAA